MSFVKNNALSAYSPNMLILMLYDGALAAISKAKFQMEIVNSTKGNVESISEKGKAISHAIAIIEDGLMTSLNMEVGGELAGNLYWLYEYLAKRLVLANVNNDIGYLEEVSSRLSELRDAWSSIETRQTDDKDQFGNRVVSASGVVTYGKV